MNRLKEHWNDQLEILKVSEEERQEMYKMKNGTFEGEMTYLRNVLKTLERWIDDETAFRVKNEDDLRTWFEQKVNGLNERIKNEEKQSLERERKLIFQFQEGLSTINEIVKGTKEQNIISLSHSQTILNDSMKTLADTLEDVRNSIGERQQALESEISLFQEKLIGIEQSTFNHSKNVNEFMTKEISRFELIVGAFEKLID